MSFETKKLEDHCTTDNPNSHSKGQDHVRSGQEIYKMKLAHIVPKSMTELCRKWHRYQIEGAPPTPIQPK